MGIRTYPDKPRAYLDMDGVLADFAASAQAAGMHPREFKKIQGAYADLPLIQGAKDAVLELEKMGFLLFSLTKIPAANPGAASDKLLWIKRHFPSIGERVIISPDKGAVGTARDFLVDDMPEWANANNFPGTVVRFESWETAMDVFYQLGKGKKNAA